MLEGCNLQSSRVVILGGSQIRRDLLFEHFMVAASQAFWKGVEGSNGSGQEGSLQQASTNR